MTTSPLRRRLRRGAAVATVVLVSVAGGVLADGWTAFGSRADGDRAARMASSPQWAGSGFENPQPLWNDVLGSVTAMGDSSPVASPDGPLPVLFSDGSQLDTPPASGLRVTWLGHSTMFIELDGLRVLTDPIFGGRASPFSWAGPKTWYDPPIALADMPDVDVVVISHDHYDHLQTDTIQAMRDWSSTFVVPLGVGAHLEGWGIPADRIVELDWWDKHAVGTVDIVATPARHASGRFLTDQNATLWAGYAIVGPDHRVFFSGDTGLFPGMADIGDRLGPFDLTMIEVGAYHRAWPDWHIGPEQAIRAHGMLRGEAFLPVHWGLWNLAMHGWTEPIERVLVAAEAADIPVATPRPGESFEPAALPPVTRWWPELPWQTAEEHPIVSTAVD